MEQLWNATATATQIQVDRTRAMQAWLWSAVIATLFVCVHTQDSLLNGVLALPPTYDDVVYFNDAAGRYATLQADGVLGLLQSYRIHPAHSPSHSALALLGFSIFGVRPWAAVVSIIIPLTLFLRFFFHVTRSLTFGKAVMIALAILFSPFFGMFVLEFRPDALCGLLLATGALMILLGPWSDSKKWRVGAGAIFGLALLAKPSISPLTLTTMFLCLALVSLPHLTAQRLPTLLKSCALTSGTAFLIAAPHYLVAWRGIAGYIYTNIFGQKAHIWALNLPLADQMRYYLDGEGGATALDNWLYASVITVGVAIFIGWRGTWADRYRIASVAAVIMYVYFVVTFTGAKTPFLGLGFSALIIVTLSIACVVALKHLSSGAAWVSASALLIAASLSFQFPRVAGGQLVDGGYAYSRHAMLREVASTLAAESALTSKTVYVPLVSPYVTPPGIGVALQNRGQTQPQWLEPFLSDDLVEHQSALNAADFVIAFSPESSEPIGWLPSAALRETIAKEIDNAPDLKLIQTIPDPYKGGAVLIYKRQ